MIDLKACPLWLFRLLPFLRWWPGVTPQTFKSDSVAALTPVASNDNAEGRANNRRVEIVVHMK